MNTAIIAAAGMGSRMASDRPKQFLQLAGIPIIFHTLKPFEECDSIHEVIVVLPAEQTAAFLEMAGRHGLRKLARVVPGGTTRADSVKRGLIAVRAASANVVAVHDGVRPFVTVDEIENVVDAAESDGAAILVGRVTDTIKQISGDSVVQTLERRELRRALTPQCFRYELLRKAYDQADVNDPTLTDESALVEKIGAPVTIIEGSSRNIKITTPEDLLIAEAFFRG
ncbi:MAG TPA: 2-C-methyl-D-erythritol 4-phosphate cytidylyltransferase [Pyrinomonadaceae bacterium]|jgi:2-C-methyl-D-erythritol 4-phosphate cytidylyltransferase|nr:2-C-methyl-D-erythritol 4-phosphate cytidylyltransferase [Pyrinomonadaceae bacterium]